MWPNARRIFQLGVKVNDVHNLCRKPQMAIALGRQQFDKGHKCYFLKMAVNEFIAGRAGKKA